MKNKKLIKFLLVIFMIVTLLTQGPQVQETQAQAPKKVVLIGIDGLSKKLYNEFKINGVDLSNFEKLEEKGSILNNVRFPRPAYAGATSSVLTGKTAESNGILMRHYNQDEKKYYNESLKVNNKSIFNIITENSNKSTTGVGWRIGANRLTNDSIMKWSLPESDKFTYYDYPSGDNNLVSISDVAKHYESAVQDDFFAAFSNDLTQTGWKENANQAALEEAMTKINKEIGEMINTSIKENTFDNTVWIIAGLSDLFYGYNKIDHDEFLKIIQAETQLSTQTINNDKFTADIGMIKQYRQGFGQLYFNEMLSKESQNKVEALLNDKSSNLGKFLYKAVAPKELSMPEAMGDLILWPEPGYSFSSASNTVLRTDDLNNEEAFVLLSHDHKNLDIAQKDASLIDLPANILNILNIDYQDNLDGQLWTFTDNDEVVPTLVLTNVTGNEILSYEPEFILHGGVSTPSTLTVNNDVYELSENLSFAIPLSLKIGLNKFTVKAENTSGSTEQSFAVNYKEYIQDDTEDNIVVYINWDGFAQHYLETAIETGREVNTLKSVIDEGAYFNNAYTSIPSITNAMQPIIVSGTTPKYTDNHYRYFDKDEKKAIQESPARKNRAETIAEALSRQNVDTISINQFALEERGTSYDDPKHLYVSVPGGSGLDRFDYAINFLKNYQNEEFKFKEFPRFMALYMDELDGLGHNEKVIHGFPVSKTEAERMDKTLTGLEMLDKKLGEFIAVAKEEGLYEKMTFILTTDHGMSAYGKQETEGDDYKSSLPDLIETISNLGYKVESLLANENLKNDDTDIVIVTVGLQAQISILGRTDEEIKEISDEIIKALEDKEYYGTHLDKSGLKKSGVKDGFADLIISPKVPYNFKTGNPNSVRTARGQHDSLDDTSQKVPLIMWGNKVKKGVVASQRAQTTTVAPTIAMLLNKELPYDADAPIYYEVFDVDKPLYKTNEAEFEGTYLVEKESEYIEIRYSSTDDVMVKFQVNDTVCSEVFFPNTHGKEDIKRINKTLKMNDEINVLSDKDNTQFKLLSLTQYIRDDQLELPDKELENPGDKEHEEKPKDQEIGDNHVNDEKENNQKDIETNNSSLPQTGKNDYLIVWIFAIVVGFLTIYLGNKRTD